jgi:peptide/nickel transport system substrate-binding protein
MSNARRFQNNVLAGAMPSRRAVLIGGVSAAAALQMGVRTAAAAEPTTLVGIIEEDPALMNPAITAAISSYATGSPVYNALTNIRPDGSITPELAESWDISPDGLTYTFRLRKDVLWHDDVPFTSADVKFSLENANSKLQPWGRGAYRALDHVETPDPYTAVLKLKQPQASLLLGTDRACSAILPKHIWEGSDILKNPHNQKPLGTGPYKFAEYVSGESIRYVRNTKYFGGAPSIEQLIFRIIPDPAARIAAFENGDVDMIYHGALPFSEAPRLSKLPGVSVKQTDLRGAAYLGLINTRRKPYDDVRVRHALAHAIDRGFVRDNIATGYTIKMVGPVPPASSLHNDKLTDYAFDPRKAAEMLDAAGYPKKADGTRFTFDLLWPSYDILMTKTADIIYRNLSDIGIKVNLQPLERAALNQKGYVGLQFDMIMETFGQGPDPDIGVERLYNTKSIFSPPQPYTNASGYSNPEVDRLFDEQRVQVDPAKRKEVYGKLQELVWNDLPVLPIFAYAAPNVYRSSYVKDVFDVSYGNQENFAKATLVKS